MPAVFFDTNVLVYAYDNRDQAKQQAARALLKLRAVNNDGVISTQVVQEFCNVSLSKLKLAPHSLSILIDDLLLEPLLAHTPDAGFYRRAIALQQRYKLSFYDSLIVQAAIDLGCTILYSEDLQDGQRFEKLTVKNPFN